MGPRGPRGRRHAAHAAARRRRRRPHARPDGRVPRGQRRDRARVRARRSTTAATPASGRCWTTIATAPTRPAPGRRFRLHTDLALGIEENRVRARHVLDAGERALLRALVGREESGPHRRRRTRPLERIDATTRFWRAWLGRARIPDHRFRDPIQRSALTIKGLTYMPTGATVAALTTSLPETPGGERNWDYRYTWIRDTTFTLQALHLLNLDWEADEFMQFVADARADRGRVAADHVRDRRAARPDRDDARRPLRLRRRAAGPDRQRRLRPAPERRLRRRCSTRSCCTRRRSQRLPRRLWPLVQSQAECATRVWREPDQGIWEARGKPQHYVSSKLMCWVALDRAAQLAEIRGDARAAGSSWRATAEEIKRRHPRARRRRPRRPPPALRDRRARRLDAAGGDLRVPARRRRAAARDREGDRRGADRERLRAPLPHRRDRRRPVRQGGDAS